ncbi:MAG TPA: TIGR03936 family radical SAM-associated protein [Acidimicrobiia bacterium]
MRGDAGFPVRLRFTKRGKVRFISHRDVARAFERAFRIVALPLAFTQGFSPRPKVSFGLALSVGYESEAEYLDVELTHEIDVIALPASLSAALPEGIDVVAATPLADRAPALQESVIAVEYDVVVAGPDGEPVAVDDVRRCVERALDAPTLMTTRRRKGREVVDDVRPLLRAVDVLGSGGSGVLVRLELATQPSSIRPGEVVAALGDLVEGRVLRTHQWIERGGARLEPLEADPRPRAVEARAS